MEPAALVSLEPLQHRNLLLNELKAAREAQPTAVFEQVTRLLEIFQRLSELSALRPLEWEIYLALAIKSAESASGLEPDMVGRLVDLHYQSTLQYQCPSLFRLYMSFVLAYFSYLNHLDLPFLTLQEDDDAKDVFRHTRDSAAEFAHLEKCPRIHAETGTYEISSLPSVSRDQTASSWAEAFSVDQVRSRIREAYSRCAYQLQESQSIWQMYISFELAVLSSGQTDKEQQLETVRQVYLARLRVPHAAIEETFQAFSTFVTQYLPPEKYETEMSSASRSFAESRSTYQAREKYEDAILASRLTRKTGSRDDVDVFTLHWKPYLIWQRNRASRAIRGKDRAAADLELELTSSLSERAIFEFALYPPTSARDEVYCFHPSVSALEAHADMWKRLSQTEKESRTQQEQQMLAERLVLAESIWIDYISILVSGTRPDASRAIEVASRSVRVLPTSVQLYAISMRQIARFRRPKSQIEALFERLASPGAVELKGSQFADLCLARLDCERELAAYDLAIKSGSEPEVDTAVDMEKFMEIYAFASYALGKAGELPAAEQDTSLRLERFVVTQVESTVNALGGPNSEAGSGLNELAEGVWQTAVSQQPDNVKVYQQAAAYWTRRYEAKTARLWYKAGLAKLERSHQARASGAQDSAAYDAFLQEWLQFEHNYGAVQDIELVESKIRSEREKMWEAWYAASTAYTQQTQEQSSTVNGHNGDMMAVEGSKGKRKAEDVPMVDDDAMSSAQHAVAPALTSNTTNAIDVDGDASKRNKTQEAERASSRDREHCSVLVANLSPETDSAALRTFLRGCGRIVELTGPQVVSNGDEAGTSAAAAALVEFADASGAASARTRDQKQLADRNVSIHFGWQCTLFVTNFPEEWEDADIRQLFAAHGTIFTVRWPSKRFVSTRRFCYVQYTSPAAAEQAASALDKYEAVPGRAMNVALSDPARRKGRTDAQENNKELFVSGLPRSITEEELKVPFEEFGPVTGVRLLRSADGKARGLGFVDFAQSLDAQRAMRELNSTKLRGKTISVVIAENRGVHGAVKANANSNRLDANAATAEQKARSVRVYGLPADAQEALIQQAMERSLGRGSVKTVFWTPRPLNGKKSAPVDTANSFNAVIELTDLATAGRAVLIQDMHYGDDQVLRVAPMDEDIVAPNVHLAVENASRPSADLMAFVPRASRGRGRGRGGPAFARRQPSTTPTPMEEETLPTVTPSSGQDRFRAMLHR